jgi:hypothetical protein
VRGWFGANRKGSPAEKAGFNRRRRTTYHFMR